MNFLKNRIVAWVISALIVTLSTAYLFAPHFLDYGEGAVGITIDDEVPEESIADEIPAESIADEIPAESIADELPAESIADDEPPAELIDDTDKGLSQPQPLPAAGFDDNAQATVNEETPVITDVSVNEDGDIVHVVDQIIETDTLTVTLSHITFRRGGIFDNAEPGTQYIAVNLTIENTSGERRTPGLSRLYANNVRIPAQARGTRGLQSLNSGGIEPGRIITGYRGHIIPLDTSVIIVEIQTSAGGREIVTFTVEIPQTTANEDANVVAGAVLTGEVDIVHIVDQTIETDVRTVTLNHITLRRGGMFNEAAEGMQYVAVNLTIENTSDRLSTNASSELYVNLERFSGHGRATNGLPTLIGAVDPGSIRTGYHGYRIPLDAVVLIVYFPATHFYESMRFRVELPRQRQMQ